jgi:hypothetical protein
MIEFFLKKFENIKELPTHKELENIFSGEIFDEKLLTEVEFKLTQELIKNQPNLSKEHWSILKRRWINRWS